MIVVIIFARPLLVFIPKLFLVKQEGLLQYGTLASRYTQMFEDKWVTSPNSGDEALLGDGRPSVTRRLGE